MSNELEIAQASIASTIVNDNRYHALKILGYERFPHVAKDLREFFALLEEKSGDFNGESIEEKATNQKKKVKSRSSDTPVDPDLEE